MVEYNRTEAVRYAKEWALKRNPRYYNFDALGGDCTNFASQCVFAGSRVMNYTKDFGWYYINANDKSPSWTGVEFFYNFMTSNKGKGPIGEERNLQNLMIGDLIQLGSSNDFYHTLVLTEIRRTLTGVSYYICAHTFDAYQRPLSSYSYEKIRGIHIIGVNS